MFRLFFLFYTSLQLTSIQLVFSDILCKDSRIDSITYSNDLQMYFFTSAGHYWWLKEAEFPPTDKFAKQLPSPFTLGQAAVYIDTASACINSQSEGEKVVWVEEYINDVHKLMTFDAKTSSWRPGIITYNQNHCISKARIDWASGKRVDAMFVRNNLEIYVVQDNKYAMVDCNYLCTNPESGFGNDKPQNDKTDFRTINQIFAMFVKRNQILYMFNENTYFELTIEPNSKNGRLETTKHMTEKNIIKDFMKIENPGQCLQTTTQTTDGVGTGAEPDIIKPKELTSTQESAAIKVLAAEEEPVTQRIDEDSGNLWTITISVLVVVVIIVVIATIMFIVVKPNTKNDVENSVKEKAVKEKKRPQNENKLKETAVQPIPDSNQIKLNSEIPDPCSSTITVKSNLEVVG